MTPQRRHSLAVDIAGIAVGGGAPIVVQSMTNTDTADVAGTVAQVRALALAGSELVRVTVNTAEAAAAVPGIRARLDAAGCTVPLIGDFHFNGHKLLQEHPGCARQHLSGVSFAGVRKDQDEARLGEIGGGRRCRRTRG